MACVDPPHTSIHPPVKFENPDMEYNIQTLKLLISILRPFVRFLSDWHIEDDNQELIVRLKHMDDVVQKVIQEFFQPLAYSKSSATTTVVVQLVFSNLNILKSLLDEIDKIDDLRFRSDVSVSSKSAKHVVSFVDSLLVNLKDIFVCRADAIVPMKKEIEDVKERLLLMRNFLWLIEIFIGQNNVKDVFSSAQILAVKMSYLLLAVCMMNDEKMLMVSCMKGVLPYLVDEIDTLQMEIIEIYEIDTLQMEFKIYVTPTMDEHVLEFADYVVHKLRQMSGNEGPCFLVSAKDLVDILVDELSFLRFNLMNILFQNPVNEMKSLIISTQALIFKTGLFICKSSKTKEDKQMAEYCCFKLPDLLKAVENIKQQASSLFNKFFSGRAWKSNCLSTNVLEYANFLINKLDELLRSEEAAPLNAALKHQIETAYEEIVSVRKFLLDIAAHLGNSQMEFVSTKYKDAACQAEFVIDSFLAGEGSTWCHELGIFVVTKDVKILHKEVKSLVTMMMTSDSVRFSSGTSSQANEPSNNNATAAKMPRVRSLSYYHYKSQSDVESKGAEDISKQVVIQYLPPRNGQSISETFGFKDFLPICKGSVSESNFMDRLPVFGHPRQLYYGFFLHSSATDSVKQILQEQRDMSNDQLNLIVVGPLI
ncbi:hypothetical protein ACH5RR_034456 [Cinchona calisaya]|uniref:Late blight resistance protein R1A-like N-terminal domain-containing protein n=1 Tax=Cinchona calisaya TaxID=153742 RepID=A0ABD2YEK3_9GENT